MASLGKVLGNRTTLYKYLNPGVVVLLTARGPTSGPSSSCGVYAVDGVKGTILYSASVPPSGGVCDVKAAFTENWLVYHYYDADAAGVDQAKGYRMVSVEFYEGSRVDDKIGRYVPDSLFISYHVLTGGQLDDGYLARTCLRSLMIRPRSLFTKGAMSSPEGFLLSQPLPQNMVSRSRMLSVSVTLLSLTRSYAKHHTIPVAGTNHQVQSFPRRFLDPRRPNRKPTSEEQEEWLMQYDPLIPDDPKHVLSHKYQVRTNMIRNRILG